MLKCVYSILIYTEICTVYICDRTGEITARETVERRERERMREKGERVRDRELQRKGLASDINLTVGQIFQDLKQIILGS